MLQCHTLELVQPVEANRKDLENQNEREELVRSMRFSIDFAPISSGFRNELRVMAFGRES